jgi:hypothetical protein
MNIFKSILSKIVGTASAQPAQQGEAKPLESATTTLQQPTSAQVDIVAVLTEMASKNPEKLNWRESIVDLMKLVGIDSSLTARKELASELGYTGDTSNSAAMNIWLHKQVMTKLAENGGVVPAELL